jgi:hypothetical protein
VSDEPVGSVGEEAAKLLSALNDWAKESGAGHVHGAASAAEGLLGGLKEVDEHVATGAAECRYCPVCQAISLLRSTSPEVKQHLATAASSQLQAEAGVLATSAPDRRAPDTGVQKIDLDDDVADGGGAGDL